MCSGFQGCQRRVISAQVLARYDLTIPLSWATDDAGGENKQRCSSLSSHYLLLAKTWGSRVLPQWGEQTILNASSARERREVVTLYIYLRGAWQLLCAASPVAANLQSRYRYFLLFHLRSHWKLLSALKLHLEEDVRGVCPPYFWLTYVRGQVWLSSWGRRLYKSHDDVAIFV